MVERYVHIVEVTGSSPVATIGSGKGTARLHTDRVLRLSTDLPVIVEVVEEEARIQEILPDLDTMIGGGLVTLEKARVILYRSE